MPTDPNHRALLRAIDGLTTQVRRIADTLEPPVVDEADGATTGDDTERPAFEAVRAYIRSGGEYLPSTTVERNAMIWRAVTAALTAEDREASQLRTELDRIRRALDPDDEAYIQETVNDQLAMSAKLKKATAAIDRVRAIQPSPPRSEFNARTNAQDEGWGQALVCVRAALIGPIAEG